MKTEPPHILCINPWIHDFAAFDFWAKPLGLLSLAAVLRQNGLRVSFLDCTDRFHPLQPSPLKVNWDGRGPFRKTPIPLPKAIAPDLPDKDQAFCRYGIDPEWMARDLKSMDRPDLVLVTSLMTYWATGVAETIAMVKAAMPGVPVVLGGIYASLCEDHARQWSGADQVVAGPGEAALTDLIQAYTGHDLRFLPDPEDLDSYPFAALDLQNRMTYAPILTSRGCPFHCAYCAASFLEPGGLRRRSPGHVFREIRHWHDHYGICNFPFYDDALLVRGEAHAFPLFEQIIQSGMDLNFHTPNALHVREITAVSADLMFRAGFKTIRLGLETTDFSENRHHDVKVRAGEFARAVENLKRAGFQKEQLGAYLLCGLPDQDLDEVARSMDIVRAQGLLPVLAYYTPIPHTPMWDQALGRTRLDIAKHPVFTNNSLFPCVRTQAELDRISQLKKSQN